MNKTQLNCNNGTLFAKVINFTGEEGHELQFWAYIYSLLLSLLRLIDLLT